MKIATTSLLWANPAGEKLDPWLQEVKACGYDGVSGFSDWGWKEYVEQPSELQQALRRHGLEVPGVILRLGLDFNWVRAVCAFAAGIGARSLVCLGGQGREPADRKALAQVLNRIGEIASGHGLKASYHHHTGFSAENFEEAVDLLGQLDRDHFFAMCDTGHATKDFTSLPPEERAAAFIRACAGRLDLVELKDWSPETDLNTPLGEGQCDFVAVRQALRDVNYDGWLVVEQNGHVGPSRNRTSAECARLSRNFIKKIFSV